MKFHELANIFPMMDEAELGSLREDIEKHGLAEPIVLYEGKILDGRNRSVVCFMLGIKPKYVEFKQGDPLAYVISKNLKRRHLTESQRAMVAAKLETMKHGGNRKDQDANLHLDNSVSRNDAASLLNVSPRTVASAHKVETNGIPELGQAVETGKMSVSLAATLADADEQTQRDVIAKDDKKAIIAAAREVALKPQSDKSFRESLLAITKAIDNVFADHADELSDYMRRFLNAVRNEISNTIRFTKGEQT